MQNAWLELVYGLMDQLATEFKVISITLFRHISQLVDCMFVSGSLDSMSMHFAQGSRHACFPDHTHCLPNCLRACIEHSPGMDNMLL